MKLLHIINNLSSGGAEKLLLETLPLYREKRIDVHLLLLNNRKSAFYEELLKNGCCPVYILSNYSVYNPVIIVMLIPWLRKFNLIHVHLFPALYWVALSKIISFSNVKLFFTEHSTNNRRRTLPAFRLIDRYIYSKYKTIVTISPAADIALRMYLGSFTGRINLIPNGINLRKVLEATPYAKSDFFDDEKAKIIIQVSRFCEPKNQATVIHAMSYLPSYVKLMLVGDGESVRDCRNLAKELKVEQRILFTGVRMDVPRLLKTADIVVLSSKYEGLSLASLEGMASGRPLIASDVPGIRDVVKGAGILFPQGDHKALASEILKMLSDESAYKAVSAECQQRVVNYRIEKMIDQYLNLWNEFVDI